MLIGGGAGALAIGGSTAFGAGTAATIAPIRVINYQGKDYELRPFNEWEFAPKVSDFMDELKRGNEEDIHHWNKRII